MDELSEYLDKRMPELAGEHGKTEEEKNQLHFVLGGRIESLRADHQPGRGRQGQGPAGEARRLVKSGKVPEKFAVEARNSARADARAWKPSASCARSIRTWSTARSSWTPSRPRRGHHRGSTRHGAGPMRYASPPR